MKFLADVGYAGPRHFDAHPYRTEDYEGVKDFARGCMRTYLILKVKAAHWNADKQIQALLQEIARDGGNIPEISRYSDQSARALLAHDFDRSTMAKKRLPYEPLDQLTVDILAGVR